MAEHLSPGHRVRLLKNICGSISFTYQPGGEGIQQPYMGIHLKANTICTIDKVYSIDVTKESYKLKVVAALQAGQVAPPPPTADDKHTQRMVYASVDGLPFAVYLPAEQFALL